MLILTQRDELVLQELAQSLTQSPDETIQITERLKTGFATYGSDDMIRGEPLPETHTTSPEERKAFFLSHHTRLLNNLRYAGRKSEEVFTQDAAHLTNTLKRLGIPNRDLEDLTQQAVVKFWRFQHAERYNPLTSSWKHHVYLAVSRMAASYWQKRSRDPMAKGFFYQQYDPSHQGQTTNDDLTLEPYEIEHHDQTPEEKLIVEETLHEFEEFLKQQKTWRTGSVGNHKEICTILAPGTEKWPVSTPTKAYMIRKSSKNCRIELESGDRYLIPTDLVTDRRPNPNRQEGGGDHITRTPFAIYEILMQSGAQVEEIAERFKVGTSTVHNWIRELETLFQQWWLETKKIPPTSKYLAKPTTNCPGCGYEHTVLPEKTTRPAIEIEIQGLPQWRKPNPEKDNPVARIQEIQAHWCDVCYEYTLDNVKPRIRLPYPWGHIRGNHDLLERSSKYRPKMTVQRCSL